MGQNTSLVTNAARTAAGLNLSDFNNSVNIHVGGDWDRHNVIAVYSNLFPITVIAPDMVGITPSHNIPNSKWLRMTVTIDTTDYAVIVPAILISSDTTPGTGSGSGNANSPIITTQPSSVMLTDGAATSFSVAATGTQPLLFQWQKNGINIFNATSTTYSVAAVSASDQGSYLCIVRNEKGEVSTRSVLLRIQWAITKARRVGNLDIVLTTATAHGIKAGDKIDVKDIVGGATINGTEFTVTEVTNTTITYQAGGFFGGSEAGGTVLLSEEQ